MREREDTMADHVDTHDAEDDARNASILIWVSGRLVPKAQATVSVYRYALNVAEARRRLALRARSVIRFRSVSEAVSGSRQPAREASPMSVFASHVNIPAPPDNVPAPRGRGPWCAALVSLAAIVTAVSGCSSTGAGPREAAGGLLGTRICIENNFADGVNVTYTVKDSDASRKDPFYYEGDMPKDTESCAEGYSSSPHNDVEGNLVIPGQPLPFRFAGSNYLVLEPKVWLSQRRANGDIYLCTHNSSVDGFDIGETRQWDNGIVRISLTRQNDDQYKEFFIRLEPSQGQRVGDDPCIGDWAPMS